MVNDGFLILWQWIEGFEEDSNNVGSSSELLDQDGSLATSSDLEQVSTGSDLERDEVFSTATFKCIGVTRDAITKKS